MSAWVILIHGNPFHSILLGCEMKKFIVRVECLLEVLVVAENIDDVSKLTDDFSLEKLDELPKQISEVRNVTEIGEM